ncbi:MAG TPA: glutamyl-tRNA reductase [Roseiflexaceae bacterium]|nr:glutamyl-tRNA reductase [Roseiflexaceae bacterium]
MQLAIIGTHQRTCPVVVRERLAFGPETMREALLALRKYTDEGFIVSTCNRVEVGGLVADGPDGEQALMRFLADWHQVPIDHLARHLYSFSGAEAVQHLFRLASGLDSTVLGEDQVMGQVKAALADAQAAGVTGQRVNRLLNSALSTGKLVRTRTEIARSHLSTISVALDIARETLGDLRRQRLLVVGAGKIAELALKHLRGEPPRSVTVVSRTLARAQALADAYGVRALPFEQLEQALRDADVVVSCTASAGVVIDAELVQRAREGVLAPLLLLDQAVPRDVDERVKSLANVRVFDIDDIRAICEANRAARSAEVAKAEALVADEVAKFMEWWAAQEVVPTIRALRERAEAIRQAEIERTFSRLPDLSPREQDAINALSAAIINKLLHQPITSMKDPASGGEFARVVQQLFQLDS